jgi:OFA family oxalate/formate antiporter-like MFS transporter
MLPVISTVSMPSIILGSFLAKNHLNPKLHILIGGSIGIIGCYMSSFTKSYYMFLILFAGSFGIANGLTYIVPLHIAWMYFPKKEGFIAGIIIGSFGLGGFIYGIISSYVVNP